MMRGMSSGISKRAIAKIASGKKKRDKKLTREQKEEVKQVTLSLVETKQKLTYTTPQSLDVPYIVLLNGIGQGDDNLTREGNRIRVSSIEMRFACTTTNLTSVPTFFYMALVLDRQPNGATFSTSDLYDDISGAQDRLIALRNNRNLERFKVLWRGDYIIGKYENQGVCQVMDHTYVDLSKLPDIDANVRYTGSSAAIAGLSRNAYYLVMCPSSQANFSPGSNFPQIEYMVKLNFKDA